MKTVRERILDAITAALEGIDGVGAGGVFMADADLDPSPIVRRAAEGLYSIEITVGHDEPGERTFVLEDWKMPVGLSIALPSPLPIDPDAGDDSVRLSAFAAATRFGAAVYALYTGVNDPGRWPDADGNTALETLPLGGGGVYLDPTGNVTEHAMLVHYRHRAGDPYTAL